MFNDSTVGRPLVTFMGLGKMYIFGFGLERIMLVLDQLVLR